MRGHVRKRGSTWTWYLDIEPDPLTGRRRQQTKGGFRSKKACEEALAEALAKRRAGELAKPSKQTVQAFLEEQWLPVAASRVRPSTAANYRTNVKVHVVPLLGDVRLQALSPNQLNAFYGRLLAGGRRDHRGLAWKSVRNIHAMLHKALRDAMRWGYVVRNVADAVDPPNGLAREMQAWTPEQLRAFLTHVRGDPLFAAWTLFATTGMRRGEVAGLRDLDLDLDAGYAAPRRPRVVVDYAVVVSEPKTRRGRRLLALDPATVAALQQHLDRRAADRAKLEAWEVPWQESGLLFTDFDGSPLHPDVFTRRFRKHVRRAGLPPIRLHDVRHTYATAALAAGVPVKVVSERLGHATTAITENLYMHVLPGMDRTAADLVAGLILQGAPEGSMTAIADRSVYRSVYSGLFGLDMGKEVKGDSPAQDAPGSGGGGGI
jgi:integrase